MFMRASAEDKEKEKLERFKRGLKDLQDFELVSISFGNSSKKIIKAVIDELKERELKVPDNLYFALEANKNAKVIEKTEKKEINKVKAKNGKAKRNLSRVQSSKKK